MTVNTAEIKEKVLEEALKDVPFDGWNDAILFSAVKNAGYEKDMTMAVFPDGVADLVAYFSQWADEQMMKSLKGIDPEDLKIRARVKMAAMRRYEALEPYKESVQKAAIFWARPFRSIRAKQVIWATADKIWNWAGDTATDYNRYTKRGLLSMVLASSSIYWLTKNDASLADLDIFMKQRIEEVLKVGQAASKLKDIKSLTRLFPLKTPFSKGEDAL